MMIRLFGSSRNAREKNHGDEFDRGGKDSGSIHDTERSL